MALASKTVYEIKGLAVGAHSIAEAIASDIAAIASGDKAEIVVNGVGFTVYYDEQPALGDNGRPVRGDVVGDFEVHLGVDGPMGLQHLLDVHVSPHGDSGYGTAGAKGYAVQQVALAIGQKALSAAHAARIRGVAEEYAEAAATATTPVEAAHWQSLADRNAHAAEIKEV